jgi:hypothetical protein
VEDVGINYGHLVYFTAIWNILWLFGIFLPVGNPDVEYDPELFDNKKVNHPNCRHNNGDITY